MNAQADAFRDVPLGDAYTLLVPGCPVLVASRGIHHNLAPIAWNTPLDYEPVTKVLFVCDPAHQTAINIHKTGEFALCVPASAEDPLIEKCGSVSDPRADKFAQFAIESVAAVKTDVRIPATARGWIECRLIRTITEGSVEIFLGEAVWASARRP
jgi:flavin reductase (DIM6/NTAB) family NADH-FMN oxidoreductase RutF